MGSQRVRASVCKGMERDINEILHEAAGDSRFYLRKILKPTMKDVELGDFFQPDTKKLEISQGP
jgi:hypothetical protein